MTKKELLTKVAGETGLSLSKTKEVFESVCAAIADDIAADPASNSFKLDGIGTIKAVKRNERTGKNPKTGEALTIPAHYAIVLKAASGENDLKARL